MLVVGLTGNLACGKTTAAGFFKELGAYIIEADEIARKFTLPDTPQHNEILKYFGKDILDSEGNIDRRRLGQIVFCDKHKLKVLNKILHPPTIDFIKNEVTRLDKSVPVVVIESALILETDLKHLIHKLIVVKCTKRNQLSRFKEKRLSLDEGKKRISAQLPLAFKKKKADFVINNNWDIKYLKSQVKEIWEKLKTEI
ncbi:dephospho-CoA kinase [Candidatus Desantisbacteria bacterium]|nr:dephospho-CoA kinase [Candidatus Desantisbacteria bacterium]